MGTALYLHEKVYTPAVEREPSGLEWRYLWLIPFTFYIIWYYTLYGNSTKSSLELALEPKNTIALFFINAGAFLVYYIVARLVIEQQKNLRLQENNHLLEMQNLQYDYLQDKIKETRRYKHDVRHHIALMQELLKRANMISFRNISILSGILCPIYQNAFTAKHICKRTSCIFCSNSGKQRH